MFVRGPADEITCSVGGGYTAARFVPPVALPARALSTIPQITIASALQTIAVRAPCAAPSRDPRVRVLAGHIDMSPPLLAVQSAWTHRPVPSVAPKSPCRILLGER